MGPRDEEHDLARNADRQPDVARDPLARHDEVGPAARQEAGRSARQRRARIGAPDTGRVDDDTCPDPVLVARQSVADPRSDDPTAVLDQGLGRCPGHDRRPVLASRTSHRQRVARVVLDAVVEQQAAAQVLAPDRRRVGDDLGHGQVAMPAPVLASTEDVVQGHAGLVERARGEGQAEQREQERLDRDEMRRQVQDPRSLGEGLAHQPEAVLLEIAQAAVDQP